METSQGKRPNDPTAQVQAKAVNKRARKTGPLLLVFCLFVALALALFVPLFTGDAAAAASSAPESQSQPQATQAYSSTEDAAAALGFAPALPGALPEGYRLVAIRSLEGGILEMEYASGHDSVLYRTAPGKDDLSGDNSEYAFTRSEENGGVTRSYSGAAEDTWQLAVWADRSSAYAILAPSGLPAGDMRAMAESIA